MTKKERYSHCEMIDETLPASGSLQEVVHLALDSDFDGCLSPSQVSRLKALLDRINGSSVFHPGGRVLARVRGFHRGVDRGSTAGTATRVLSHLHIFRSQDIAPRGGLRGGGLSAHGPVGQSYGIQQGLHQAHPSP